MSGYEAIGFTIVYIDESGFAQSMPRTHGYSKIGARCFGIHDWHAKGRINAIGALINKALLTIGLFETTIDSDVFYGWVTQDLLPKLTSKTVVCMDNATFHTRQDIKDAILQAGHILEFTPKYSPDLNPIEHKWAQAKSIRRKTQLAVDEIFGTESFLFG
jgi:transposase